VDEGILSAEADFEKLSDDEYDECLSQLPAVLSAVEQYWQQHPVTEADMEALTQAEPSSGGGDNGGQAPPRHRSGHWLH